MTDHWAAAIASAEAALRGDASARARASTSVLRLTADAQPPLRPGLGRDVARLTAMLEALGLAEESQALLRHVVSRLVWDPRSISLSTDVRNELAVSLADRGHIPAAGTLLATAAAFSARDEGEGVAGARTLANLAAVKFRLGDLDGAQVDAGRALGAGATDGSLLHRLQIRLLAHAVLAEVARHHGRDTEADELVHKIADSGRQLVRLLGGDHPASLSALVTLARAEFGSARAAADHERQERAVDVLAVAAQKTAATLGSRHPLSHSALVNLATSEFEAAQASGDEARLDGARAMMLAVSQRPEGEPRIVAEPSPAAVPSPYDADAERQATDVRLLDRPSSTVAPGPEPVDEAASLRFGVLGPVRIWRAEEPPAGPLAAGSPQQRALLAVLLLRGGRTAGVAELLDAIWGESPPARPVATIRTYAARLRRVLARGMLVTESGGYALHRC